MGDLESLPGDHILLPDYKGLFPIAFHIDGNRFSPVMDRDLDYHLFDRPVDSVVISAAFARFTRFSPASMEVTSKQNASSPHSATR